MVRNAVIRFRHNLKAYMNACFMANMHDRAQAAIIWYIDRSKTHGKYITYLDRSTFNVLLKGWADKGNLEKVAQVLKQMQRLKITKDIQTYSRELLCEFNQPEIDIRRVDKIMHEMRIHKMDPADILRLAELNFLQKSKLCHSLMELYPTICFKRDSIDPHYKCEVLKDFHNLPRSENHVLRNINLENIDEWYEQQHLSELQGFVRVKSIYDPSATPHVRNCRKILEHLKEEWQEVLKHNFIKYCNKLESFTEENHGMNMYPYLKTMDPQVYVNIMLDTIEEYAMFSENFSPPARYQYYQLGELVSSCYLSLVKSRYYYQSSSIYKYFLEDVKKGLNHDLSVRRHFLKLANQQGLYLKSDLHEIRMPGTAILFVGRFLQDIMVQNLMINPKILKAKLRKKRKATEEVDSKTDQIAEVTTKTEKNTAEIPLLFNVHIAMQSSMRKEIRVNLAFHKLFKSAGREYINFRATMLPTVVPPLPWLSVDLGGYLLNDVDFIRSSDMELETLFSYKLIEKANIDPVLDALNAVSMIPWRINERVLDVLIHIFSDRKGDTALSIPLHSSKMDPFPTSDKSMTPEEKLVISNKKFWMKRDRAEMYSLWCNTLYKLSIANHFRKKVFWFPHNIDFRGRAYATPPHFNHLGDDVARSILLFAEGKPLGENGLDWLKIHLINLTGLKKRCSLSERLEYANEIMPLILDSADNPLGKRRWWTESEEPWQTLACCIAIADAVRSPDVKSHICSFPVHQDGSCNGLQHYAALGRDTIGAASVNLSPADRPADVYSDVLVRVEEKVRQDIAENNEIALILDGKITRKVIKQTVMTYVYGVTMFGAKYQIKKQLKEILDAPKHQFKASVYLAKLTFDSIGQMFTNAQEIQFWLNDCAKMIASVLQQPVQWVTPLGFPVIQPYSKFSLKNVSTQESLNSLDPSIELVPKPSKQRTAFPPNFIHSLDSSHMMLTALHCERRGLYFVAVHDSYWTHPCDVKQMGYVCREQFVMLHSQPILNDLCTFFRSHYGRSKHTKQPAVFRDLSKLGDFDLNSVMKSVYFFS